LTSCSSSSPLIPIPASNDSEDEDEFGLYHKKAGNDDSVNETTEKNPPNEYFQPDKDPGKNFLENNIADLPHVEDKLNLTKKLRQGFEMFIQGEQEILSKLSQYSG
jgi:hypothetical protein